VAASHRDLEFHVGDEAGTTTTRFKTFDKAAGFAVARCCGTGSPVVIDVITWSRAAARAWGGEAAVEQYETDPEASVHERIVVRAEALGRIA
jgi:hypothetical protein